MNTQTVSSSCSRTVGRNADQYSGMEVKRIIGFEPRVAGAHTFEAWRAKMKQFVPGVDVCSERKELQGELSALDFAGARLWSFRSSGQRVFRNRTCERRRFAPMAVVVIRGRALLTQSNRECELQEGTFAFFDSAQPLVIEYLEDFEHLYLHFPKTAFSPAQFHKAAGQVMHSNHGMNQAFFDCVRNFWEHGSKLNPLQHGTVLCALISLSSVTTAVQRANFDHSVPVRVSRAIAFIEQNLGQPWLNPRSIAEAQHVSRRHLDELFSQCGHRIESWIWERRLERAVEELGCYPASRGFARKTILQIALDLGFKSPSHFSRTFATRFGISPREYRKRTVSDDQGFPAAK